MFHTQTTPNTLLSLTLSQYANTRKPFNIAPKSTNSCNIAFTNGGTIPAAAKHICKTLIDIPTRTPSLATLTVFRHKLIRYATFCNS